LSRSRWRRAGLLLLAGSLFAAGCTRQNILEDLGLVLAVGYDLSDDGKMLVTITMPEVSEEAKEKTQIITSKGDISKEAGENLSLSTDRQLVNGQLRTAIYSEKLARHGIWRSLDTIRRDVNITSSLILCISDGEAREILKHKYPDRPRIGRYINELLKKEAKRYTVPKTTLHDFERHYYSPGSDPFAPYIQLSGGYIRAAGTALFRNDKFVGSLSPEETKLMLLLEGRGKGGDIKQALKNVKPGAPPDQVMLTFVHTKMHKEVKIRPNQPPLVRFKAEVSGEVIEYTGEGDLTRETVKNKIEHQIEQGLQTRIKDLLNQLQHKYRVDPLGIGDNLRATGQYDPWNDKTWRKLYEEADIEVEFNLKIVRTGMTK
jgi:spore germination protein